MYKKLGEIKTIQERIATGHWADEMTRVYVIRGGECYEGQPTYSMSPTNDGWPVACVVGYYEITHSSIMAGTWEEWLTDIGRIIDRHLIEDGYAKRVDTYTSFATLGFEGKPVLGCVD